MSIERRPNQWNGIIELTPLEVWEFYNAKGFTKKQREWILDRDGGCVLQREDFKHECERHGLPHHHNCKGTLHVHHIAPRAYLTYLHYDEDSINRPDNGITLCAFTHIGWIHGDMDEALKRYRGDKSVIQEVFEKRKELLKQGLKYWNDKFDVPFAVYAQRQSRLDGYPYKTK